MVEEKQMVKRSNIFLSAATCMILALNVVYTSAASGIYVAGLTFAQMQTRTAPDNSTITVEEIDGTRIETRTFNEPTSALTRIVRTTNPDGTRRTRVFYRDGQVHQLNEGTDENILEETGDVIAGFARTTVDVTKEVAGETAEVAGDVVQGAGEAGGVVRERSVEGAKATVETGKDVVEGTSTVAKRAGSATGKAVEQTVETGGKVAKGTGKVVTKGAKVTAKTAEKTVDVAGDIASGTAKAAGKTAEGAATVTTKTVDAAQSTGSAVGRGLRAIGRGFKRVFGS